MRSWFWLTILGGCGGGGTPAPWADLTCADIEPRSLPFTVTGELREGAVLTGTCGGEGPEATVAFRAPWSGDYVFDTHLSEVDTVLYALDGCGGAEIACDDDGGLDHASRLALSLSLGEGVLLVVDGPPEGGRFALTGTSIRASETRCDDGFDDDGDQQVDCADPDCAEACEATCPERAMTAGQTAITGDTTGGLDQHQPSCSTGPSSDRTVLFEAPSTGRYGFGLSTTGTPWDSVLSIVDGCDGAELACADAPSLGGDALAVDLVAGQQVIAVIDGQDGDYGPFELAVFAPTALEGDCADGLDDDLDGLADCLDPDCDLDAACAEVCDDGLDDDGDGLVDCYDPGCDFDPACPEDCANHVDDDGDELIDCADGACAGRPECGGGCPDLVLAAEGTVAGSTVEATDDLAPSCGGEGAPEVTVTFTPTVTATYVFDTFGSDFDTVLAVLDDCGGSEVRCNDDAQGAVGPSRVALPISAGDTVVAVVDGLTGESGRFVLNVARAPLQELDCADGIDDDFDGLTDCDDPGCAGLDGCGTCPDELLQGSLPIVRTGTTSGTSEFSGACSYGSSPDRSFEFTAPTSRNYTFSTAGSGFDTVLSVLDGCNGAELACNDDSGGSTSEVQLALTSGQTVIVVVDGYGGAQGSYRLSVQ